MAALLPGIAHHHYMVGSIILSVTEATSNILINIESQKSFTSTNNIVKMVSQLDQKVDSLSIASSLAVQPALSTVASATLPSPFLCPRRMFLASLILVSKFSQDKCHSNCAWTKLSGLPASKIGRCERASEKALDWHL
jgi:hypothetical protein